MLGLKGDRLGSFRAHFFGFFICLAGFCFGYDTGIVGGVLVLPSFRHDFGIDASNVTKISSLIVGLQQAGCFVSAVACAPITERLGRRLSVQIACTIFCVGVLMEVINPHSLALFYAGRVVAGLGLGASTAIVPMYNAEMSPTSIRGRLGGAMQWLFVWGVLLSYWVDYAAKVSLPAISKQWQIPVGLQMVPAGLLALGLFTQKESVRWLVKKERYEDAWDALTWHRASSSDKTRAEFEEIKIAVQEEILASQGMKKRELLEPSNRWRIGLAFGVFLGQQCTGATALAYFGPQFFSLLAGGDATRSLLITGLFGVIKVISTGLFLIFFSDRLGRKPVLFWSAFCMSAGMIVVAVVNKTHPAQSGAISSSGIATVAFIFLVIFIYCFSWGPIPWIYTSEIFPSRIREVGVSVGVATQWLFNFTYSLATPYMIKSWGWGTFLFYAALDICMAAFVWFCVRETCGKTIEEMEFIFHSKAAAGIDKARSLSITEQQTRSHIHAKEDHKSSTEHLEEVRV